MSKARSNLNAFLKAGKQSMHTSNDDTHSSGDQVMDLVIRLKTTKYTRHDDETTEEPKQVIRRVPLKQVLQRQENIDTDHYYKPQVRMRRKEYEEKGMRRKAMQIAREN